MIYKSTLDQYHGRAGMPGLRMSKTCVRFSKLIAGLLSALANERAISSDAFCDPAFRHWQVETDNSWAEARLLAENVSACDALEPEDHLLQRMAWLIRLVLEVETVECLRAGHNLVANHIRMAAAMPLARETSQLLQEAKGLVDEIVLQALGSVSDLSGHDEINSRVDLPLPVSTVS